MPFNRLLFVAIGMPLLSVALGVALCLILVEIGARVFQSQLGLSDNFAQFHPVFGRFHIPNKEGLHISNEFRTRIKINSKGLRDREYSYEKSEEVFRILVLGDSFSAAMEVELKDAYHEIIETLLNEDKSIAGKVEVINGGYGGWGTCDQLEFFRQEGRKYQPDLVLLAFFPGNDVSDNYRCRGILSVPPKEHPKWSHKRHRKRIIDLFKNLIKKSKLYVLVGDLLPKRFPTIADFLMSVGLIKNTRQQRQLYSEKPQVPYYFQAFISKESPQWEEAWKVTNILIQELQNEIADLGAGLAVAILTSPVQIYPEWFQSAIDSTSAIGGIGWDFEKPNRAVLDFCTRNRIPVLDLLPYFRNHAKNNAKPLHFRRDMHWNVEGHLLAGKVIYDWLIAERLVPTEGESTDK